MGNINTVLKAATLGVGAGGMPIGVTLIGPRWGDAQTLAAADLLERSFATKQ